MVSKTISVTEEVYNLLRKMKLPGESFGDTITRLCLSRTTSSVREWAKSADGWSDLTEKEVSELERAIEEVRASFNVEQVDVG